MQQAEGSAEDAKPGDTHLSLAPTSSCKKAAAAEDRSYAKCLPETSRQQRTPKSQTLCCLPQTVGICSPSHCHQDQVVSCVEMPGRSIRELTGMDLPLMLTKFLG